MLLIDGVKYELWTPPSEDEFGREVKEHANDIFGDQSIYLDLKQKLRSKSGIGSIPDGYVIVLGESPCWHIVEIELSSHPLHEHIVSQIGKFISGIKNPNIQKEIVNAIYQEIDRDDLLKLKVSRAIKSAEIYKFLADLISKTPVLSIIVEKHTKGLDEALSALAHPQIRVVGFQTFVREGVGLPVHAHLFEPLYVVPSPPPPGALVSTIEAASIKYHLFYFPKDKRHFFPGYKIPFILETDIGEIQTKVTSAPKGTPIGDPKAGAYIKGNLVEWYKCHPTIKERDKVIFEVIESMKRYRLKV